MAQGAVAELTRLIQELSDGRFDEQRGLRSLLAVSSALRALHRELASGGDLDDDDEELDELDQLVEEELEPTVPLRRPPQGDPDEEE